MHRLRVVDTEILGRAEKPYQLMITKGEGKIFVTEIWPDQWRGWRYTPRSGTDGGWAMHLPGAGCYLHCDAYDAPENVRKMVKLALTW